MNFSMLFINVNRLSLHDEASRHFPFLLATFRQLTAFNFAHLQQLYL